MSSEDFARSIFRLCSSKICHNLGFQLTQDSCLDILADITRFYMERLCQDLHRQTEHGIIYLTIKVIFIIQLDEHTLYQMI
jgi:hypothetical protein